MNLAHPFLSFLAATGLVITAASDLLAAASQTQPFMANDCRAIDGDTLRCGRHRIRLLGIDAAEMPGHCRPGRNCAPGDPHGQRAALSAFAARAPLTIKPVKVDRYGRLIASVSNKDGSNASCVMIRAGARYVAGWDARAVIRRACRL